MSKKNQPIVPDIEKLILQILDEHPGKQLNYKQIASKLPVGILEKPKTIIPILESMLLNKRVVSPSLGKFSNMPENKIHTGIVEVLRSGGGYVWCNDLGTEIFIEQNNLNKALHGDTVKVAFNAKSGKKIKGEIVEIIQRAKSVFTGILEVNKNFAFLVPDDKRMYTDIFVSPTTRNQKLDHGVKAVVEITDWPKDARSPFGKLVKILGKPGENEAEMNAIVAEFGFPLDFADDVKEEAAQFGKEVPESVKKTRQDLRKILTFTIDPETAKDFDDAISYRKMPDGTTEIGVHIADVSGYVMPGTAIDREAYERGTSVYLVDRVIPMLPENLSNNLCSLMPKVDRLAFSAMFYFDQNTELVKETFYKSVIHSNRRFSYEEAQEILDNQKGELAEELADCNRIAKILHNKRFKNGSIAFETPEVRFNLDETGKPTGVYTKERKDAHKLIEEFMLLANKRVAEYVYTRKKNLNLLPFVYRVHDAPAELKLTEFRNFVARWGYKIQFENENKLKKSLNDLMKAIDGKPESGIIQQMAVRSMAKAVYTPSNTTHFGLGFKYYTHFTSPIRRYPDLLAHRVLQHILTNAKEGVSYQYNKMDEMCKHSSLREQRAAEAERASIKYKQAEYLSEAIGKTFTGMITGVTDWGIFVEIIENKCEGLVRLASMKDDYYEFNEASMTIFGRHSFKKYTFGDMVAVVVKAANPINRTIDLLLADSMQPARPNRRITANKKKKWKR